MQPNRKILLPALLASAIGLAGMPTPAAAADLSGRASMRLTTSYLLRATLSYANGTISARERITITNRSGGPISKLNLSVMPQAFGEVTAIGDYSVDGVPTTAEWTNNANLALQLGRDVPDGGTAVVRLGFKLRAKSDVTTSLAGRFSKANGIMQVSQWFPIVSSGHGLRNPGDSQYTRTARRIRLELRTDASSVRIAAPGRIVSSSGRDHVFELANARDFAFGASPSYQRFLGSAGGVTIKIFTTTAAPWTAMSVAKSAIRKFEAVYGQYQWPTYVIAQSGRPSTGNEYPAIAFLGKPMFAVPEVIAHETAHQWWYGMAGNDQIGAPWIDEALSEFSAAYFFGTFEPYASNRPVNTPSTDFPDVPANLTSSDPGSYNQTVYFKGASFLAGLRRRMGSTAFFAAMRDLFAANRNGVVTTEEFISAMVRRGASRTYIGSFLRT